MKQFTSYRQILRRFSRKGGLYWPKVLLLLCCVLFYNACRQTDLYEKSSPVPGYKWAADFKVKGSIVIKDTAANYNVYAVLRHTDAYRYNNIWLEIGLQAPGDSMFFHKVNLELGNDQHGWEGTGMDDIWEVRKLINPGSAGFTFKTPGEYHFSIGQEMRDNPLPYVMSAGLRIEKDSR